METTLSQTTSVNSRSTPGSVAEIKALHDKITDLDCKNTALQGELQILKKHLDHLFKREKSLLENIDVLNEQITEYESEVVDLKDQNE